MQPIKPLRVLFRTAIGAAGMGAGVIVASNIFNAQIHDRLPTPLTFALDHGIATQPATIAYLNQLKDVRIIPLGSPEEKVYCRINAIVCDTTQREGILRMRAVSPNLAMSVLGIKPAVFMPRYEDTFNTALVKASVHAEPQPDHAKSRYGYTFAFYHELAHLDHAREVGPAFKDIPAPDRELAADISAQPHIRREQGQPGLDYQRHFRALDQVTPEHDTSLRLPPAPRVSRAQAENSATAFRETFNLCIGKTPVLTNMVGQLYKCLDSVPPSSLPNDARDAYAIRTSNYRAAYQYFYMSEPSRAPNKPNGIEIPASAP